MKAYQPVVCATEDGCCDGLKHTRSWGNCHQLLYVQAVWGQTVGSSFSGQWAWGEAALTFSFCTNPRWSLRAKKTVLGLGLRKEGRAREVTRPSWCSFPDRYGRQVGPSIGPSLSWCRKGRQRRRL